MKLTVTFKQENQEFDKEYANEYNFGKESINNLKYLMNEGFKMSPIENPFIEDGEYHLSGNIAGVEFSYNIPNVKILKCRLKGKLVEVAVVSASLIKSIHSPYNAKYDTTRICFYFHPKKEFIPIEQHLYLAIEDFPKELLLFG